MLLIWIKSTFLFLLILKVSQPHMSKYQWQQNNTKRKEEKKESSNTVEVQFTPIPNDRYLQEATSDQSIYKSTLQHPSTAITVIKKEQHLCSSSSNVSGSSMIHYHHIVGLLCRHLPSIINAAKVLAISYHFTAKWLHKFEVFHNFYDPEWRSRSLHLVSNDTV